MRLDLAKVKSGSSSSLAPTDVEALLSTLLQEINTFVPGFQAEPKIGKENWFSITLPVPQGAEYEYEAHVQTEGERLIAARLLNQSEDSYFWYLALELPDFHWSASKLSDRFFQILRLIFRHPTRIIQRNGMLFGSFTCQYEEDKLWHRIDGNSFFRFGGFKAPRIEGRRCEYHSPALINTTQ